jgi:hypothetical protein
MEGSLMNFIAPGLATVDDVLLDQIDSIISDLEYSSQTGIVPWVGGEVSGKYESTRDTKIRDTSVISIPMPRPEQTPPDEFGPPRDLLNFGVGSIFRDAFQPHLDQYFGKFGIDIQEYDGYQVLKYGIGQKFDRHADDHWRYPRRVSMTYYANDEYEGGEIEFDEFEVMLKPRKGQLLIFPSTYVYTHTVHPVTAGTRYAVVQWMK